MLNLNAVKKLLTKVSKENSLLGCIKYEKERLYFTNKYSLIVIYTKSDIEKPLLYNVFDGLFSVGNYYNVDGIVYTISQDRGDEIKEIKEVDNYYLINDVLFDKKLVDVTFKTINISFNKINKDYLRVNTSKKVLTYNNESLILISILAQVGKRWTK
ncbi:MAG TPA: hypothetical protein GX708_01155 [Gallicola sp.]|nr:hypothetical protein [Gallicola sp.]